MKLDLEIRCHDDVRKVERMIANQEHVNPSYIKLMSWKLRKELASLASA